MDNLHFHEFFPDLLTEGHCVMVNLPRPAQILEYAKSIPDEDVYNEEGKDYGKEKIPHITVFYGIDASAEKKAKHILSRIPKNISAELGKINKFENASNPFDVLMIEVKSPQLAHIHEFIKRTCENHDEWPSYHPHVTIAYVKKGTCNERIGDSRFAGMKLRFDQFIYNDGVRSENMPVLMKEYLVGQSGGYGGGAMAGGPVAPRNWAGTPNGPQTSRRLQNYPATRRYSYMQGNTVVGNSLYDTITQDDLTDPKFTPDQMFSGLRYEMKRMEYPDKDVARPVVLKNLSKDPNFYSDLQQYFHSDTL